MLIFIFKILQTFHMHYIYRKLLLASIAFLLCTVASGQKLKLEYLVIPDSLKKDANAIVRKYNTEIERTSLGRLIQKEFIAVTVLNEKGDGEARMYLPYDKYIKVVSLTGKIYNNKGVLVKALKMSDFYDSSSYQDFVFFSDDRAKMFAPNMKDYPYTVEYEYEIQRNGFVHIETWFPVPGFFVAVEEATLTYKTPANLDFKPKAENYTFVYEESKDQKNISTHQWSLRNFRATKRESYMPRYHSVMPFVLLAPVLFEYQGFKGDFTNWSTYGKWVNSLLAQRMSLTEPSVAKIKELTANLPSNREKVKAVYQYMQNKTRYIAVMEGIGGLQPMLASDVDKFGYGDCKALSNYTRTLLAAIGIPSFYTTIGADNAMVRYADFASKDQTNHVILTVPLDNDTIFLECTNPYAPFGYLGVGSSNRKAIMITDDGGKVVYMPHYSAADNVFSQSLRLEISPNGNATGELNVSAKGLRFEDLGFIRVAPEKDQKDYLLRRLPVNNLEIEKFEFRNEGDQHPVAYLDVKFKAGKYGDLSGNRMFFPLNNLDKSDVSFSSKKGRTIDVHVPYGMTNEARFEFILPAGYDIDFLPKSETVESPYGYYAFTCELVDNKILYARKLVINGGTFKKEEYPQLYDFFEKVGKLDNAKVVLKKI